jgi:general stress protein 26
MDDQQHHLWDMIHDIRFGMLVNHAADGHLHSRPLTTQNREFDDADRRLWFFISRSSALARDLGRDGQVNLAYANPDDDRYVSVAGRAELVEDPARVEALWSMPAKAWFPGGPTDADLQLLGVRVQHAEYWDVKSSKMVQLFKMAKAAATGRPPTDMAEHGEVR